MGKLLIFLLTATIAVTASCSSYKKTYSIGNDRTLTNLLNAYQKESTNSNKAFILIQKIIPYFTTDQNQEKLLLFLSDHINKFSKDPYNPYYTFRIAETLMKHTPQAAAPYFKNILRMNSYLQINNISIRKKTLENLIAIEQDPYMKVLHIKMLIRQYPLSKGNATYYLQLANLYASQGEWEKTYQSYLLYQNEKNAYDQGITYQETTNWIRFYRSKRNWTKKSLSDLIYNLKIAFSNRNIRLLRKYQAKHSFFAMSWNQQAQDKNSQLSSTFNIGAFLARSHIHYKKGIEDISNYKEAYLKTWGWSYRIPIWYLYFRRIDFPADPEVNGNWEWAGIFFGNRL